MYKLEIKKSDFNKRYKQLVANHAHIIMYNFRKI